MIFIKVRAMLIIINLEIYEDKNVWNSIYNNTYYFKEVEIFMNMIHNEVYNIID